MRIHLGLAADGILVRDLLGRALLWGTVPSPQRNMKQWPETLKKSEELLFYIQFGSRERLPYLPEASEYVQLSGLLAT